MELRVLKYFLTLCEMGSITAAAKKLNMTQPALSRQMQSLEEELGDQLFIREKKGIVLTDAGFYLSKRAMDILNMADRTILEFPQKGKSITGSLHIGAGECIPHFVNMAFRVLQILESYNDLVH